MELAKLDSLADHGLAARATDVAARLRVAPGDLGGPSRMDMLREREEAAILIEALTKMLLDARADTTQVERGGPPHHCFKAVAVANTTAEEKTRFGKYFERVAVWTDGLMLSSETEPGWRPAFRLHAGKAYAVSVEELPGGV